MGIAAAVGNRSETVTAARRGQGFGVASRIYKFRTVRRPVPNHIAGDGVSLVAMAHILLAAIEVDVDPGRVPFQCGQTLIAAQRRQGAIGVHRGIRQARRAIAAYTVPVEGVESEVQLLEQSDAGVPAYSTGIPRGVIGSERGCRGTALGVHGSRNFFAGINTVAEAAKDTEDFIVSETRFKGRLDDDVWRCVEGIIGVQVVQSAAHAGTAKGEVRGIAAGREDRLRILQRLASHRRLLKFLATRRPYCRAQLNPT